MERTRDGQLVVAAEVVARLAAADMLGRPIAERRREALRKGLYGLIELPELR